MGDVRLCAVFAKNVKDLDEAKFRRDVQRRVVLLGVHICLAFDDETPNKIERPSKTCVPQGNTTTICSTI